MTAPRERGTTGVSAEETRGLLLELPGVEEGPCYGTPGFRVRRRFLARLRDNGVTLVVKCGFAERDFRLKANPNAFYTTDHYRDYPTILVRLAHVDAPDLKVLLEDSWRLLASKRLVAQFESRGDRARDLR